MSEFEEPEFRPVNPLLGTQPKWGPFPAEQLVPWFGISLGLYIVCNSMLRLPWIWTALLIFWGCGVWWMLTGSKPWRFLSQFIAAPNWVRGRVGYQSVFTLSQPPSTPSSQSKRPSSQAKRSPSSNRKSPSKSSVRRRSSQS
jgi:hypothetical protein